MFQKGIIQVPILIIALSVFLVTIGTSFLFNKVSKVPMPSIILSSNSSPSPSTLWQETLSPATSDISKLPSPAIPHQQSNPSPQKDQVPPNTVDSLMGPTPNEHLVTSPTPVVSIIPTPSPIMVQATTLPAWWWPSPIPSPSPTISTFPLAYPVTYPILTIANNTTTLSYIQLDQLPITTLGSLQDPRAPITTRAESEARWERSRLEKFNGCSEGLKNYDAGLPPYQSDGGAYMEICRKFISLTPAEQYQFGFDWYAGEKSPFWGSMACLRGEICTWLP